MCAETTKRTQIAIIGAGIAGCTAALALAKHFDVTLLDKHIQVSNKVGECLPPAARRILKQLHIEHLIDNGPHLISQGMVSYWGSTQPTIVDNLRNPDGLGWHLDRRHFESQLRAQAKQTGVHCIYPVQLVTSNYINQQWQIEYQQYQKKHTLYADIVIDASGRHCVFARQQGVVRKQLDKLMSIWLTAQFNISKSMALIASSDKGWWYSAPLPSQMPQSVNAIGLPRVVSWQLNAQQLQKNDYKNTDAFLQKAHQTNGFRTLIEQIIPGSEVLHGVVAANTSKLEQVADKQWFAIGDAAMSFDPLSSQGMFNAMASAIQLTDLIKNNGLLHNDTPSQFQLQMDAIWQQYLNHRNLYYAQADMAC
ncbi:Kynurenine 3-monooxygenase [Pseudoalteromonas holothuriae]|uniref:Kynurenine 3-monooxygenase n=1 Tax=Pseudoalteromonas holothuriae TaxID=2963714 RepID=A0A9W4VN68_9GAMM|nr:MULTISPECIES: FAD-dependent oxidoreductase [unclassified Pseudoalteromonas]CAH9049854.1 Kynurenine 3-monooxygenase [Pseudoalteromonas sp. CIP111951]CAH9052905.1 Kynurenine 3-monooxygenase [Pseudoalteromonas sp. CIP111854]